MFERPLLCCQSRRGVRPSCVLPLFSFSTWQVPSSVASPNHARTAIRSRVPLSPKQRRPGAGAGAAPSVAAASCTDTAAATTASAVAAPSSAVAEDDECAADLRRVPDAIVSIVGWSAVPGTAVGRCDEGSGSNSGAVSCLLYVGDESGRVRVWNVTELLQRIGIQPVNEYVLLLCGRTLRRAQYTLCACMTSRRVCVYVGVQALGIPAAQSTAQRRAAVAAHRQRAAVQPHKLAGPRSRHRCLHSQRTASSDAAVWRVV